MLKYKPIQFIKGLSLSFFIILFAITGCATHKASRYTDSNEIEQKIRGEFKRWRGTQHILGGIDQKGIDCSGFVMEVYKKLFNIELPRTAIDQAKKGVPIDMDELQAGDLVFFRPPTFPHHVGIYLSGDKFVHTSKSKGVIISHIDSSYWTKYYWTARRILHK